MKKLVLAMGLMALASGVYAACNGPFCYDDTSAAINSGVFLGGMNLATTKTTVPVGTGEIIYCTDCAQTPVCISTAATRGSWAAVSVSSQATNGLGLCK